MVRMSGILKQLKKEQAKIERQLSGINAAISAYTGVYTGSYKPTRKGRKISAAGRARIAAAQRKRWAKIRAAKKRKS